MSNRTAFLLVGIAALFVVVGFIWLAPRPVETVSVHQDVDGLVNGLPIAVSDRPSPEIEGEGVPAGKVESALDAVGEELPFPPPVDLAAADRDRDVFGVVVDGKGRPVAGATIETILFPERHLAYLDARFRSVRDRGPGTLTAIDGTFSLRLESGAVTTLRAAAEGFAPAIAPDCNAGEQVRIVLGEPCELRVRVVDSDGQPVALAHVKVEEDTLTPWDPWAFRGDREAEADAEGLAVFDDLNESQVRIIARHPEGGRKNDEARLRIGEPVEVVVTLDERREVVGSVKDATTGAPVDGAEVRGLWDPDSAVVTDTVGQYEIRIVLDVSLPKLQVHAAGYQTMTRPIPVEGPLDFALERGHRVVGRVVTRAGKPVIGARVVVFGVGRVDHGTVADHRTARTAEEGAFVVEGLHPAVEHYLRVEDKVGRQHLWIDHRQAVDGTVDVGVIHLLPARRIEGRTLDASGLPLPRASVFLAPMLPGREDLSQQSMRAIGRTVERWADDLGRFRFLDLVPGSYRVGLRPKGRFQTVVKVTLTADSDLLDVILQAKEGEELHLVVEGERGIPIEGVSVGASGGAPGSVGPTTITGDDGHAVLQGLPNRPLRVWVGAVEGYLRAPQRVITPAGQEVRFVLMTATEIRGHVRDEGGKPVSGVQVISNLLRNKFDLRETFSGPNGEFSLACPPGSIADLRVAGASDPYGTTRSKDVAGPFYVGETLGVPAPTEGVVIVVQESPLNRHMIVRVIDPQGTPVPDAHVRVKSGGHQFGGGTGGWTTKEDGRVRIDGLPPTKLTVEVSVAPGRLLESPPMQDAEVVPAGQEVVVAFERGLAVQGVVVDEEGNPVPDVVVSAVEPGYVGSYAESASDGSFRMIVPDKGPYLVRAVQFRDKRRSGSVEGVVAPARGLRIALDPE